MGTAVSLACARLCGPASRRWTISSGRHEPRNFAGRQPADHVSDSGYRDAAFWFARRGYFVISPLRYGASSLDAKDVGLYGAVFGHVGSNTWRCCVRLPWFSSCIAGANLSKADLAGAKLLGADLSGAVLRSADLSGADLRNTCLRGADLTGARVAGVQWAGADLTGAVGAPTAAPKAPADAVCS